MELYYEGKLAKLYLGDASKLDKLTDKSIDLTVTDPPYGIGYVSNSRKNSMDGLHSKIKSDDVFPEKLMNNTFWELHRVMKQNTALYMFTRWDVQCKLIETMKKTELPFELKNIPVWVKDGGGMGDLVGDFGSLYESCLYIVNGKHELRGKRESNVWAFKRVDGMSVVHPTQKPTALISWIISKSCPVNGTVLDCFAGSSTTLVAATLLGINSIGVALKEEYCLIGKRRLQMVDNVLASGNLESYAEMVNNSHDFTVDFK